MTGVEPGTREEDDATKTVKRSGDGDEHRREPIPALTPSRPPQSSEESSHHLQRLPPSTISMSGPSGLFSGGAEAATAAAAADAHGTRGSQVEDGSVTQGDGRTSFALPPLGNLHKRRASASPEKFNTGKFEPLPLRLDAAFTGNAAGEERPAKRTRLENKIEISYDSSGTPRITSITPTFALPSGRSIAASTLLNSHRPTPSAPKKPFSILSGLLRHNDLLLLLVSYLTIPSLINLYAISKPFHFLYSRHSTAFTLSCMRTWAPDADKIYPWRCYKSLCFHDPTLRAKASMVGRDARQKHGELRDVPGLRWLQMVVYRQGVCKDMLIQLATKGLRCPSGTLDALRKLWFLLDLPLNAHRIALCRSEAYITNHNLSCATLFFLKVDMAFTDPAGAIYRSAGQFTNTGAYPREWERRAFIGCDLREMLMAEKSFTPLWRVLRGLSWDPAEPKVPLNRLDVLRLWVRHKYHLPDDVPEHVRRQSIMGIPWHEVGTAGLERTSVSTITLPNGTQTVLTNPGLTTKLPQTHLKQQLLYPHAKRLILPSTAAEKPREQLLRPEELVMREGVRRRMELHKQWGRMMLWGFCDELGRNLAVRTEGELLRWSNGEKPLSWFMTDREVMERRELERKKREEEEGGTAGAGQVGEVGRVEEVVELGEGGDGAEA